MAMAQNQAPVFLFAAALLLLAAAAPLAYAQFSVPPPPALPRLINVGGILSCPSGGGLTSGVNVSLTCSVGGVGSLVVGTATTGLNGQVIISPNVAQLPTTVSSILARGLPLPCVVSAPLNRIACPALSTVNGTVVGVLAPPPSILFGNILTLPIGFSVQLLG